MTERRYRASAYAKLNLALEIGERKDDGFHDIRSIFHSIDLADTLELRVGGSSGGISVSGDFGCPVERSTVYRAAAGFMAFCGIDPYGKGRGIELRVIKNIPSEAGLGGGSTDAAAVLRMLDLAFSTGLGTGDLAEIGAAIGSDVPFFLHGGAAFVSGRGERVEPLQPRGDFFILLIKPPFGISTPWAYRILDEDRAAGLVSPPDPRGFGDSGISGGVAMVEEYGRAVKEWRFGNDFLPTIERRKTDYGLIFDQLRTCGAEYASLSGSGSCAFGLFRTRASADAALGSLRNTLPDMVLRLLRPLETSLALS